MMSPGLTPFRCRSSRQYVDGLFTLILLLAGCGESSSSSLGIVTGTVKQDGRPVANLALEFHPVSGGRPSLALSDEQGRFQAFYLAGVPGAKIGTHSIRYELVLGEDGYNLTPAEMFNMVPPRLDDDVFLVPSTVDVREGENRFEMELTTLPNE